MKQREITSPVSPQGTFSDLSKDVQGLVTVTRPVNPTARTDTRRLTTRTHTHTRSIFIVFGSAAVYVLPSLSATHTLHSKNKNLYYRPASVTTIILLKQPLKTNYICTVFSSDCSGWAMLTGWVGFPFHPQTPPLGSPSVPSNGWSPCA